MQPDFRKRAGLFAFCWGIEKYDFKRIHQGGGAWVGAFGDIEST